MSYFGDDGLDQVCRIFFDILGKWATGESEKHLLAVIDCVNGINRILPSLILQDEKRFCETNEFLIEALLLKRPVLWKAACFCIFGLMKSAVQSSMRLDRFTQHFVVIMDGIINLPITEKELMDPTAKCIFLMKKMECEVVDKVLALIIDAFEPEYRERVRDLMKFLGGSFEGLDWSTSFHDSVESFQIEIQKYSVELSNIDQFAPIFTRKA
jgi:hypothetical protein